MRTKFITKSGDGWLLGACKGLGDRTGIDPVIWRAAAILLVVALSIKLAVLAYCGTAIALRLTRA